MPPRILIAEDDALQAELLRGALERRGYAADVAADGFEAVRRLRAGSYDLALLDYHMPEIDGLATARLLHEMLRAEDRPRLIALTAASEELAAREAGPSLFDLVVPKRLGLPALLSLVEVNLVGVAASRTAAVLHHTHARLRDGAALRWRRRTAPLAALPALAMTVAFMAALVYGAAALRETGAAAGAVRETVALGTGTAALVGALQDAETSQRLFLATGAASDRAAFEMDAQRVDRALQAPSVLAADGMPGFDAGGAAQAFVAARLGTLADAARDWHPAAERGVAETSTERPTSAETGRATMEPLRAWADNLVDGAERSALADLARAGGDVRLVLAVLAAGICFGLWHAAAAVRQRWRPAAFGLAADHPTPAFRPLLAPPGLLS